MHSKVELKAIDGRFKSIPGPYRGREGIISAGGLQTLDLESEKFIGAKGGLMLWVRLDTTYQNGIDAEVFETKLLEVPELFELKFSCAKDSVNIALQWYEGLKYLVYSSPIWTLIPGIPGPAWYHLAFRWDADEGIFEGYLNGTPMRIPEEKLKAWKVKEAKNMVRLYLDRFAVSSVKLLDEPFGIDELCTEVPNFYWGSVDNLLGAGYHGTLSLENVKGKLLYERELSKASDVAEWIAEGPVKLEFEDGWMKMDSERPKGPKGNIVYWCDRDFPEDFIAEWEFQCISHYGLCIVFFSAKGKNNEDIFHPSLDKREGIFSKYHSGDINCYHISYYANTPNCPGRSTSNMRKNHGCYLVATGPISIPPGSKGIHKITLAKIGPEVQLGIDGERSVKFYDDGKTYGPVLGGGKIGLRQMQWMIAKYRNFRIYEVSSP